MPAPIVASAMGLLARVEADVGPWVKGMDKVGKTSKKTSKESEGAFGNLSDILKKMPLYLGVIAGAFLAALAPSELFRNLLGTFVAIYGSMVDQIIASLQPAWQPFLDLMVKLSTEILPQILPHLRDVAERVGPVLVKVFSDPEFLDALKTIVIAFGDILSVLVEHGLPAVVMGLAGAVKILADAAKFARDPVKGFADAVEGLVGILNDLADFDPNELFAKFANLNLPSLGLPSFDPNELWRRFMEGKWP